MKRELAVSVCVNMRGSHKYSSTRALIPLIKTCFSILLALTSLIETAAKMNGKNENEKKWRKRQRGKRQESTTRSCSQTSGSATNLLKSFPETVRKKNQENNNTYSRQLNIL